MEDPVIDPRQELIQCLMTSSPILTSEYMLNCHVTLYVSAVVMAARSSHYAACTRTLAFAAGYGSSGKLVAFRPQYCDWIVIYHILYSVIFMSSISPFQYCSNVEVDDETAGTMLTTTRGHSSQ
jgi:hypothetical protein